MSVVDDRKYELVFDVCYMSLAESFRSFLYFSSEVSFTFSHEVFSLTNLWITSFFISDPVHLFFRPDKTPSDNWEKMNLKKGKRKKNNVVKLGFCR